MGGFLSALLDIVSIATELSASTGFSVEAIITGEAAAAIETEVAWLMELETMTAVEAMAVVGLEAADISMLYAVPSILTDAVGLGVVFQTVSGASALVAAGVRLGQHEVSVVNRNNMALALWRPEEYWDVLFPGVNTFAYSINVLYDWASSLYHTMSRQIWDSLVREGHRQIEGATRALAIRTAYQFHDTIARLMEHSRWVITNGPSHFYRHLEAYYSELPKLNPAQARNLARRLNTRVPDRLTLEREQNYSGEIVETIQAPGGAHQRVTPDWMLPLILGLYGDITPAWGYQLQKLEEEEDGPKKKRRRRVL
ncbi:minor capsid protein VP2 [Rhinolophus affinis polyomavirus 1]|nr:minor capsid protein VP2 [Rhinolophus affinis polyomavirus 1]BBG62008.1 minor capsid protein VP2 [Rhinolophus affinis polyomavirus 1]BBG62130.1 minor capsid protein VP2 [Rhinolophus affinis polyomavirus 1]